MKRLLFTTILVLSIFSAFVSAQNELFNKGLQQYDAKQYEQAAETFRQVIAQSPNFYQAHYNLGLCLYFLKRYTEAISPFQQSLTIKSDYARAYYQLGNTFIQLNRYDEAIASYQKNIQYEPTNANSYYRLGIIHHDRKKHLEAEKSFKKAIELNPKEPYFKTELGKVYNDLKMFPDAIAIFNEAIQINPNIADAHFGIGNSYYNNNKYAESIPYYKKTTELLPTSSLSHQYLADAYYYTKQYSLALASFETSIQLDNKRVDAYYGMGLTYIAQKNKNLAQQTANSLKSLDIAKADLLQKEINKMTGTAAVAKPPVKSAQRIKDEQDVAKMADFGFDGAVVTQIASIRQTPKTTGKLLLSVKRGDILSLVARDDNNDWFQVVDEKTGTEGWIDGKTVVIKLTNNKETGPPLLETGLGDSSEANPIVFIANLEEKTTLSLRINGTLYQIPPKSTKTVTVPAGKFNYYGWSPGIRPAIGSSTLQKGKKYNWSFKINRR